MAVNPFGFTTGPVTFWLIIVYAAFLIPLVWIHESVPSVNRRANGVNVTEAWHDLTTITRQYHPYNSRANEDVGKFLLQRIEEILVNNGVEYTKEKEAGGVVRSKNTVDEPPAAGRPDSIERGSAGPLVTIFDDTISNVTYVNTGGNLGTNLGAVAPGQGTYFEGTNKLVYVRGEEDEDGEWWKNGDGRSVGKGGVLVNAHYDSVSSGYGATDDGMGVVSVLQILNYYTTPGRQPKRGIVLLLNNGEEDGLYGARAYIYSPLYYFTTTFVNLEGAGAGGRAILFRTTDLETAKAYTHAPHPFGSVVAADGFKLGFIRSATDYSVWTDNFGQRGLDIAFYRPRARYHTNQDDTRHASQASLYHMLSNSLATVDALQKDTTSFVSKRHDGDKRKVSAGTGTDGVWFDMFGKGFAALELRGLFAWTLTLLIVTPLILALVTYILSRKDKYYFFSGKVKFEDDDESVSIGGWKGLFRFPLALAFSAALTIASAFLIRRINPHIIYSSGYAVWVTTLSLFFASFWTISRGASAVRPSALQRGYAHIWLFAISWAILVVVTVFADRFKVASGYPFAFLHSAVFVATLISLLDLFALPAKQDYAETTHDDQQARDHIAEVPHSDALISPGPNEVGTSRAGQEADADDEPTETTPLNGGGGNGGHGTIRTTFATGYRRSLSAIMSNTDDEETKKEPQPYEQEQPWSTKLPSWTWFIQLLFLAPITVIIFTQLGLFMTAAIQSTSADGKDPLLSYVLIAIFSIAILLPVTPFIHRATFYLPLFLFIILVISLIYNLVAFPFSASNRYKVYFQQTVELQEGTSQVQFTGIEEYVRKLIAELPSAAGQTVSCEGSTRGLLSTCHFDGIAVPPKISSDLFADYSKRKYADLVTVNVTRSSGKNKATLEVDAKESKSCNLKFDKLISTFSIAGNSGIEPVLGGLPDSGLQGITLWRRDWSKPWTVDIEWKDSEAESVPQGDAHKSDGPTRSEELRARGTDDSRKKGPSGTILCDWSDANVLGTIPAFDEALQYVPDWVAITKYGVGLVQGTQAFAV
ncbi:peptidase family m28 family [Colletotrichum sojae]|uniref:Peptide hydrolase n=1 Tax=Colletotrichum sojae TaxID=2175907 RepID=A0A8H6IXD0_9PEZI|nr:peptidase family m28 family [Colletotrichum sojae]